MSDGQLLQEARNLVKQVVNSGGFETDLTFKTGIITKAIKGLAPVHHLQFDTNGQPVDSKKASVTIVLKDLVDIGYPITNTDTVNLKDHLVTFIDSTGTSKTYVVKQNHFDNSLGIIILLLGNYAS